MTSPQRSRISSIAFAFAAITFPVVAQTPLRILDPLQAAGLGEGWAVDPAKGSLTMTIPDLPVPGDIPVPVVFRFNAAFTQEAHRCRAWNLIDDGERTYYSYEPISEVLDRPIFGSLHFGFITAGGAERLPGTGIPGRPDLYTASRCFVLEDGSQYTQADFTPFASSVGGSFNLAHYFGLTDKDSSAVQVTGSGTLGTYFATLGELGTWATRASQLAPGISTFQVLLDRDRARIYAPLGANGGYVPILWLDRFNHAVSFAWTCTTTGLPSGITAVRTVTVLNSRDRGLQLQWAETAAGAPSQVLARLDYIGIQAPSMQVVGFSGPATVTPSALGATPTVAMLPVAGGAVLRPLEVRLADPATLDTPAWNRLPALDRSGFTEDWTQAQSWRFDYDGAQAELTDFSDPRGVSTHFTWQSRPFLDPSLLCNSQFRCVQRAESSDSATGTTLTRQWTWQVPVQGNAGSWTSSLQTIWSGGNTVVASVPTQTTTFAPPGDPAFGNAVPLAVVLYSTQGTILQSVTSTYGQVGVDGSLSVPSTRTTSTAGGPMVTVTTSSDAATGLPLSVAMNCGSSSEATTYEYSGENHPDLLDPKRLTAVRTTRTTPGGTFTAPVRRTAYDPTTWFSSRQYLDGGGDGQLGSNLSYDQGRLVSAWNDASGGPANQGLATTTRNLDATSGLPSQVTVSFDKPGGQDSLTTRSTAYDSADRVLTGVDALGRSTTNTWDARGRIRKIVQDGQADVIAAYPDERTQTLTQNNQTTTIRRDGFGRILSRTRASDGVTETYRYDSNGRQAEATETNPAGASRTVRTTSDGLGRPTQIMPINGPTLTFGYSADGAGNQVVTTTRTPSGRSAFSSCTLTDPWGSAVGGTDAMGTSTSVVRDALGNARTVTVSGTGGTQTRTFGYNQLGLLTTRSEPETGTTTYSAFNAQGRAQTVTEATGRTRTLQYDGLGRLWSESNGGDACTFSYSGALLVSASSTSGGRTAASVSYGYGAFNRLTLETTTVYGAGIGGWSVGYGYDAAGRKNQIIYPSQRTATYTFDDSATGHGRISLVQISGVSPIGVTYDGWGNRKDLNFPGSSNTWTFSPEGTQPQSQTIRLSGSTLTRPYHFDPLNHLDQAGEWTSLGSDNLGRLTQAILSAGTGVNLPGNLAFNATFTHDGLGNNTAASGAMPAPMLSFSLSSTPSSNRVPALDGNGAVTGWNYRANGEAYTLAQALGSASQQIGLNWDGLGQLAQAGSENFRYLPSGLRFSRTVSGNPSQDRCYTYGGGAQMLSEWRPSGSTWSGRDIVYLGSTAIAEVDGDGLHALHSDHLGTPLVVTNAAGTVEGTQYFGPYGESLQQSGPYVPATGYTGHAQTDPVGLIYMKGRFYSPAWHRFLNSDQGADSNQLNQYAYCGGNPMMATDPTGMYAKEGSMQSEAPQPDWSWTGIRVYAYSGGYSTYQGYDGWVGSYYDGFPKIISKTYRWVTPSTSQTSPPPPPSPGSGVSTDILNLVTAAVALLGNSPLTADQLAVINHLNDIEVFSGPGRSGEDLSTGTLNLNVNDIKGQTTEWVASEISHDAFHQFQYDTGTYRGTNVASEVAAIRFQLQVGAVIGLQSFYVQYLTNYMNNPTAIQNRINQPPR